MFKEIHSDRNKPYFDHKFKIRSQSVWNNSFDCMHMDSVSCLNWYIDSSYVVLSMCCNTYNVILCNIHWQQCQKVPKYKYYITTAPAICLFNSHWLPCNTFVILTFDYLLLYLCIVIQTGQIAALLNTSYI